MPSRTARPPISFNNGLAKEVADPLSLPAVQLHVVDHPDGQGPALVSRSTAAELGVADSSSRCLLALAAGSDCVLATAVVQDGSELAHGQVAVTPVQQYNLHLGAGITEEFRVFVPPPGEPFELVDVEGEVSQLGRSEEAVQVDAKALTRELLRLYFGSVLALNEACLICVGGCQLLLRITATNMLDAESQDEVVAYHCYRGLLTHATQIYLRSAAGGEPAAACSNGTPAASSPSIEASAVVADLLPQSAAAARGSVVLQNARQRPASGPSLSSIKVLTSDGEWFPVKRQLLRPCIALTKAVRCEEESVPEVTVDVDTLTFDRVLIFLEALALGRQPPAFGLHLCPQLLAAAQRLGLRALEEYCQERLGESTDRLRFFSFEEVKRLNAAGGCWLILDGMVLDVTRWLPEHPGGSTIIPKQALNLDCSRMFEVYHASRESFVYIRQFYHGEIAPEDAELVLVPEQPSAEFLQQLREFTPWRLRHEVAGHLGSKRGAAKA